jgi:hypothetical protein
MIPKKREINFESVYKNFFTPIEQPQKREREEKFASPNKRGIVKSLKRIRRVLKHQIGVISYAKSLQPFHLQMIRGNADTIHTIVQ